MYIHVNIYFLTWAFPNQKRKNTKNLKVIKPLPIQALVFFLRVCNTGLLKTLWGKGEIAVNEQFFLVPLCFLPV